MRRLCLIDGIELDHDGALIEAGFINLRRKSAHQETSARRHEGGAADLGIGRERVRIADRAIGRDPIGFGHFLFSLSGSEYLRAESAFATKIKGRIFRYGLSKQKDRIFR